MLIFELSEEKENEPQMVRISKINDNKNIDEPIYILTEETRFLYKSQ